MFYSYFFQQCPKVFLYFFFYEMFFSVTVSFLLQYTMEILPLLFNSMKYDIIMVENINKFDQNKHYMHYIYFTFI